MNLFQFVVLMLAGFLVVLGVVATARGWASRREGFVWSMVWVVAGVAVVWPNLTTRLANVFGLDRGKNLLLYCAVIGMTVGFFMVYMRLRQVRRELTLLVRHLAIAEVHEGPAQHKDAAGTPPASTDEDAPKAG